MAGHKSHRKIHLLKPIGVRISNDNLEGEDKTIKMANFDHLHLYQPIYKMDP